MAQTAGKFGLPVTSLTGSGKSNISICTGKRTLPAGNDDCARMVGCASAEIVMSKSPPQTVHDELLRELGDQSGTGGSAFLDPLSAAEQGELLAAIRRTRRAQKNALDAAIDKGLGMAPLLLRGPLKRILFP